jgi:Double-stranded RNA binding motif
MASQEIIQQVQGFLQSCKVRLKFEFQHQEIAGSKPPQQLFTCTCTVPAFEAGGTLIESCTFEGRGSKKKASQQAATTSLAQYVAAQPAFVAFRASKAPAATLWQGIKDALDDQVSGPLSNMIVAPCKPSTAAYQRLDRWRWHLQTLRWDVETEGQVLLAQRFADGWLSLPQLLATSRRTKLQQFCRTHHSTALATDPPALVAALWSRIVQELEPGSGVAIPDSSLGPA